MDSLLDYFSKSTARPKSVNMGSAICILSIHLLFLLDEINGFQSLPRIHAFALHTCLPRVMLTLIISPHKYAGNGRHSAAMQATPSFKIAMPM